MAAINCTSRALLALPSPDKLFEKSFLGGLNSTAIASAPPGCPKTARRLSVRSGGLDFSQLLGGRGLAGGEEILKTEEKRKLLFKDEAVPRPKQEKIRLQDIEEEISGFDKELSGLTGGFPGGEAGLKSFVAKYPPPKPTQKFFISTKQDAKTSPVTPPLVMPGMTVRIINKSDQYYMFTGIVQRVTDGMVGVLFEGGAWDKLVTFSLTDVERTPKGPPGSNPKSGILELEAQN